MANPFKINLIANKSYSYCLCGKSKNGVFCDGSHSGGSFSPKRFKVLKDKDYYLCSCKKTNGAPFCDGSHLERLCLKK